MLEGGRYAPYVPQGNPTYNPGMPAQDGYYNPGMPAQDGYYDPNVGQPPGQYIDPRMQQPEQPQPYYDPYMPQGF